MATPQTFTVRKLLSITPGMAKAIADYRFQHRIATESEATRRLIEIGLEAVAKLKPAKAEKPQPMRR